MTSTAASPRCLTLWFPYAGATGAAAWDGRTGGTQMTKRESMGVRLEMAPEAPLDNTTATKWEKKNFPGPTKKRWTVEELCLRSVTKGTRKNYSYAGRFFLKWLRAQGGEANDEYSEELLLSFLTDCMDAEVQYGTVNQARSWLVTREIITTGKCVVARSERFKMALKGYRNVSEENNWTRTQPTSWSALHKALTGGELPELTAALSTIAYAFLLRWSEATDVLKGDSSITQHGTGFRLFLHRSKTDPTGKGSTLIFPTELFSDALKGHIVWALGVLAKHKGEFMPSPTVNIKLRELWGPRARFHGFRHGRCSDLLALGYDDYAVMRIGRWESRRSMSLYCHPVSLENPGGAASKAPQLRRSSISH